MDHAEMQTTRGIYDSVQMDVEGSQCEFRQPCWRICLLSPMSALNEPSQRKQPDSIHPDVRDESAFRSFDLIDLIERPSSTPAEWYSAVQVLYFSWDVGWETRLANSKPLGKSIAYGLTIIALSISHVHDAAQETHVQGHGERQQYQWGPARQQARPAGFVAASS